MLCHFFKLSRPAPLSPVPASFKLLPASHLFPFLLTCSAHAIGRWATFKSSGLGLKSFGHMHAHGLSTCALVHTYTWDMSIRQRLVSHGLCLKTEEHTWPMLMCALLSAATLIHSLRHTSNLLNFFTRMPHHPARHSQRVLFWKRRLEQPDTILTLAFNLGIISGNRDSAAQRGGSPVPIMRGQAGVWLFPIARVISCYELCSPLGIIRSMPLRNKMFSDRWIPDPNQN